MIKSSTPVTVTVCTELQFADVNVNVAGDTVASPVSADVTVNTTSESGLASNTTVNVAAVAASLTLAVVVLNVNPAVSLSATVTVTV